VTYPTCRYPTRMIDVVQLVEGSRVLIRPALPQDSDLQRAFVRNLSDEARYFRFMTRLSELPQAMAERFSTIDYQSHIALITEIFGRDHERRGAIHCR
jgi:acetyltransferase